MNFIPSQIINSNGDVLNQDDHHTEFHSLLSKIQKIIVSAIKKAKTLKSKNKIDWINNVENKISQLLNNNKTFRKSNIPSGNVISQIRFDLEQHWYNKMARKQKQPAFGVKSFSSTKGKVNFPLHHKLIDTLEIFIKNKKNKVMINKIKNKLVDLSLEFSNPKKFIEYIQKRTI